MCRFSGAESTNDRFVRVEVSNFLRWDAIHLPHFHLIVTIPTLPYMLCWHTLSSHAALLPANSCGSLGKLSVSDSLSNSVVSP